MSHYRIAPPPDDNLPVKIRPSGGRPDGTDFYRKIVGQGRLFWGGFIMGKLFMEPTIF